MARTGPLHFVGVFMLFIASMCLLIPSISSPVVNDIGLLKVTLTNSSISGNSKVIFGTWGYCITHVAPANTDQDYCPPRVHGYSPTTIMRNLDGSTFHASHPKTTDSLTHVQILHPITCAIAFLAFLVSAGAGIIGSIFGAAIAAIAFLLTLIVMATDFALWGAIRSDVNEDSSGSVARYGEAIWLVLASVLLLFFGGAIVLLTCCSARREKAREKKTEYVSDATVRRKRFGLF